MGSEQWKPFFNGRYEVSNHGRIRRVVPGEPAGRIMQQKVTKEGYCLVSIARQMGDVTRWQRVHRLVADAFLPEPKPGQFFVNHKNSNPRDNRVENLEWCTHKENIQHAVDNGRMRHGSNHRETHLVEKNIIDIRMRKLQGDKLKIIAEDYNISVATASAIVRGATWKHVPGALPKKTTPLASKLSEDEVKSIRKEFANGTKQRDLSLKYGVNPGTISMIVNNKIWKGVS